MTAPPEPRVVTVTPMVRKVIGEITRDGPINAVIAERLGIAEDTVKSHIKAALRAVGCDNRTALVCALLRGQVKVRVEDNRSRDAA